MSDAAVGARIRRGLKRSWLLFTLTGQPRRSGSLVNPRLEEFEMSSFLAKTVRGMAIAVIIAGSFLTQHALRAQPAGIKRTDLQRHDLSVPGREAVQVRVDIEPGVLAARHTHPGEEVIYVLQGSLEYQLDDKPPVTLKAGDVLFIPAGTIHSAKNVGSGTASELATYIVEKGKPLVTLVE
jgi:quercetin dioxygenase-like cupin family protein